MNTFDIVDSELVARIPSDSRNILHVGCGAGTLGEQYKRVNPLARVVGVEASAPMVNEARRRLDFVYLADLSDDPVPFFGEIAEGSVDCIVYGNVFATEDGFRKILHQHAKYLSDRASILFCLSNIEYWGFAETLLKGTTSSVGDWPAFSTGTLRLTDSDIRATLADVGLILVDATPFTAEPQLSDKFVERMAPALANLGTDQVAFRQRTSASHYIWRARRGLAATQLTVVSTMLTPVGGVSAVRVTEPMQALKAEPSLFTIVLSHGDAPTLRIEEPKIFIFHRPLLAGPQGLDRVRPLLDAGWLVVCEFDDHPDYIPVLQRPDVQNFRAVHAIQTTTDVLASVLRRYNPEVEAFDNAIATLPSVRNFATEEHITIFFAGLNRDNDWPPCMDAINSVSRQLGPKIRFEVVGDRAFFDSLETDHKNFTPICDYAVYQDILSRCEISFMPLSNTPFNTCKSDLKYIEAASHRVAALASPVVYSSVIDDGRTGVLFRNLEELELRLTQLVSAPEIARSIAEAGRQYVKDSRMLTYQLSRRSDWYHALWQRRDQLNVALRKRVPEL